MRGDLPTGLVTLLFTDVEGSTKLLHEWGTEKYADALAEHRRILRAAFDAHAGVEVDTQGDAFFVAFRTASAAVEAAADALQGLALGPIRVRMGLHSGTPYVTDEGYVGPDVHRTARIAACGHGGQVLVSAATALLAEHADLRDLGEHRLKDLSAPERIYQLGPDDFPPLNTLHQTNLPVPATPFLGRQRELAEVTGLLSRDDVRLLTLTGPGGSGKTRLATQAAALLSEGYPNGTWWLPLAPLREPGLVLSTTSQILGSKNGLAEHIADKEMLLLFDNFEQVVQAAPDLAALLVDCPNLDVLVTSREPLHVTAEREYPVPPLVHEEGISFFTTRARAVTPDFEPDAAVSEICRRLDDLPLALELAAARVKVLTTQQILERLEQRLQLLTGGARDLPVRQRTLRATIEWSYDLLNEQERQLFARLGVFRGGCTLGAAERVADADVDTLQSLVDKSLVRHTGDRYWMLETIREFAAELADDDTQGRHAEYFIELAEEAYPQLPDHPGDWLERLEPEHDNFRAALDWLERTRQSQLVLRLGGALSRFWYQRGHHNEGIRRLERALEADDRATGPRARALTGVATLMVVTGDAAAGEARSEEALALCEALGDASGSALALFLVAHSKQDQSQIARAQQLFEEAGARFRELGEEHFFLLSNLMLARLRADAALIERTLQGARAIGNRRIEALSLHHLSHALSKEGRTDEALRALRSAYEIHRALGEQLEFAEVLSRMANVLATAGRAEEATRLYAQFADLKIEMGGKSRDYVARRNDETLAAIHDAVDDTTFAKAWEEGQRLSPDEAVSLALEDSRLAE